MGQILGFLFSCFTLVEAWDIVSGRRAARRGRASDEEIARLIAECRTVFPTVGYQHRPGWHGVASGAYSNGWLPPD